MILTDEDVKALKLEVYGPHKCAVEVDALRTVLVKMTEAAVLEKLRQQKPVAEVARYGKRADEQPWHQGVFDESGRMDLPSGTKLYTAPVPAAVPDERAAFDEWFKKEQGMHKESETTFIDAAFLPYRAWKARAILSAAPVPATALTPKE